MGTILKVTNSLSLVTAGLFVYYKYCRSPCITQLLFVSPGCTLPTTTTILEPVPNVRTGIGKPESDLVSICSGFKQRPFCCR